MSGAQTLSQLGVSLDGADLSPEQGRSLGALRVQQRLSLPTLCELRFFDPPTSFDTSAQLTLGASLHVSVAADEQALFDGQVTAIERVYGPSSGRELRVRAYDVLHRLRKRQPVRAHVEVTLADLARALVGDLGLSVDAPESGPVWKRVIQHCQTDFDVLAEIAQRCGLYFTLREDVLHVLSLDGIGAALPLRLGEDLLEASVCVNGETTCRTVATIGWDPLRVERHEARVSEPRLGREVGVEISPQQVGGSGERMAADQAVQDDRQAEAIAQAVLDVKAAQEVILWGVAEGNPRLRPGSRVRVEGMAASIDGQYVITSVNHTVDAEKGFVSELHSSPPVTDTRTCGPIAVLGVVTSVDDPDRAGRVKVSLPTYNDVETDWLAVLTPGAGSGKGLLALADVDDTVLVLLVNGDPAQAVVLGGLYGMESGQSLDWGVEDGAVSRYNLLTPGGQRVKLDDKHELIRLENSDGSYVELSSKKLSIRAKVNLDIAAPGHAITIRGKSIDFRRA